MKHKKPCIGIITQPFLERAGKTPLDNVIRLIQPLTSKLIVLTGGDYCDPPSGTEIIRISEKEQTSLLAKVIEQITVHFRVLRFLSRMRREIDVLIFFLGTAYPVPLLFARAARIKCFVVLTGSGSATQLPAIHESGDWRRKLTLRLLAAFELISYSLADKLIVYSPSIADQLKLQRYAKKTFTAPHHNLDFSAFFRKTKIEERQNLIGYVGRLSEEKGVLNFIEAIPKIVSELPSARFIVIGEGRLSEEIKAAVSRNNLEKHMLLVGWVPHEELPTCLNKFKLVVIPSYTEGLPNVMLECMACGTPILATPVGAVGDIIEDGKTGFLLDNNAPACIARDVIRAISCPELESIAENAYVYVRERFTYTRLSEVWSETLNNDFSNSVPPFSDPTKCA